MISPKKFETNRKPSIQLFEGKAEPESPSFVVGPVRPLSPFLRVLECHPKQVQCSDVEESVVLPEGAVEDVHVGKSACDVKKHVEVFLADGPRCRKNAPETLQAPEETFHQDATNSESGTCPVAHNDGWNINLSPTVTQIGQHRSPRENVVDLRRVRPKDIYVVNAPWKRPRHNRRCSRVYIDTYFFFRQ